MTTKSVVTIERLACRFTIPAGIENRATLIDSLEGVARHEVARACADLIADLPGDDEAVYRIRRLHLNLWVDAQGMTEDEIAQRWGALLARAVMQAMTRSSGRDVIRFDTPRDFVAAFLRDLLDQRAWSSWHYDEFRALRSLSAATIALHLLTPRPDWIAPILLDLAARERLIHDWSAVEINRLWRALGLSVLAYAPAKVAPILEIWAYTPLSEGNSADERARDRLRLWLAVAADNTARDPQILGLVGAIIDLAALFRVEPEVAQLLAMHTPLYPALTGQIRAGVAADVLDWLPAADTRLVAELSKSLLTRRVEQIALASPFGGVFLLLPALVELGVWELWRGHVGDDRARHYLFALALKALGRERTPLLLGDSLLAAFAGLDAAPPADARLPLELDQPLIWSLPPVADWDRPVLEAEAQASYFQLGQRLGFPWLTPTLDATFSLVLVMALHRTAARLPGFTRSSAAYVAQQFIAQPANLHRVDDILEVHLSGGALSVALQLAGFPWEVSAAWLAHTIRLIA